MQVSRIIAFLVLALLLPPASFEACAQDIEKILERADKILEESKAAYEEASSKGAVAGFIDAGFKLEEARIKYLVLQEIGSPDKQKLAADRLRAVNQLSKLIHDGKVAVGGTPAEPVPARTTEPAPVNPIPAAPVAALVDVSKRAAIPDAKKQQDAEKAVRDLFKDLYVKKSPADKKALAAALLDQVGKPQNDVAVLWVLCREAQDVGIQVCDVGVLGAAVDAAARQFDVDGLAMKFTALSSAARMAKLPEDSVALAQSLFRLANEFILIDQYDAAEKAIALGGQQARKSNDAVLIARATVRSKEVAEAKALFQAMKSALETQAKTPEDPGANLEIGRFQCFVKGSWDLGLRFLVKGSDASLKQLAEKELAGLAPVTERAALADGWFELSEKDKSPLRKSQLQAHAKVVYESAMPDATGVLRARIEKRLSDLNDSAGTGGPKVDLLAMIDLKKDVVAGTWKVEGKALLGSGGKIGNRIQLPYIAPDEYDLTIAVERKVNDQSLNIGLARGGSQWAVAFDTYPGETWGTGLEYLDGHIAKENASTVVGRQLPMGKRVVLDFQVRKTGIKVLVDGKVIINWQGEFNRLSLSESWKMPEPRALFLGVYDCQFAFSQVTLTPISGQGKRMH